ELSFKSIFDTAIDNYKNAEAEVDKDIYKLSIGETDDLHNLMINTQKAQISLDLVIQLRNKALEAYNEIMRMGV
ncbi:MAG TPA: flagellar hook-basal body complex protein FliE, partial [Clostridiales bacterium]|nr:flagellar hook-basal body complex protein FliE [Clostridiales bacterium]